MNNKSIVFGSIYTGFKISYPSNHKKFKTICYLAFSLFR